MQERCDATTPRLETHVLFALHDHDHDHDHDHHDESACALRTCGLCGCDATIGRPPSESMRMSMSSGMSPAVKGGGGEVERER